MRADTFEHFGAAVEDSDIRAESGSHLRGVEADNTAADHGNLAGHHARDAAEQHAAPAMGLFQCGGAGLHAHATGDLAHRLEQRQRSARTGHGLIGDAGHAAGEQFPGLFGIRCQVEVSVKDLAFAQASAFDRLRFLDLHHHFAFGKDDLGSVDDLGASGDILRIGGADSGTGLGFDPHLVTVVDQFAGALGREADAILVVLDFLRATDAHGGSPLDGRAYSHLREKFCLILPVDGGNSVIFPAWEQKIGKIVNGSCGCEIA
jgi:hypothetical protein